MKLFNFIKLSLLTLVLTFTASLMWTTPVMATEIMSSIESQVNAGDPLHPIDVYLLGMPVHYTLLVWNPTAQSTTIDTFVIEPGGSPTVQVGNDIILTDGQTWTYSPYYDYTIVTEDLEPAVGPYGPIHKVVNTLTSHGFQGSSFNEVNTSVTKTVRVASPSLTVTKTANPTMAKVGDTIQYTITLTNTGDWELTKNSISDSLLGSLTSSFASTLAVGASESHVFDYVRKAGDPDPLPNTVTAIYDGTGFDDNNTVTAQALVTIPSVTPEPTAAPTQPPSKEDRSDGRSDGLGCASRDCSGNVVAQGQVLGATTMPSTGFGPKDNTLRNLIILGSFSVLLFLYPLTRKKV